MRAASASLIALLAGNEFRMADLYTVTLAVGTVYRYTDYDVDLVVGANTFACDGLQFSRSGTRSVAGIEVDTLNVDVLHRDSDQMLGIPFAQLAHNGGLDGAQLLIERVFMPVASPADTSAGAITIFSGRVNVDEIDRGLVRLSVVSDLELLNVQMPRNVYQPGCQHTLFDTGCGKSKAATAVTGSVTGTSTATNIVCGLTQAAGWFTLGTIEFNSGANAGVIRTVKYYAPGVVVISLPLKAIPQPGDTFKAYPGCNKTAQQCNSKFANQLRFRGFPYIPIPETAY